MTATWTNWRSSSQYLTLRWVSYSTQIQVYLRPEWVTSNTQIQLQLWLKLLTSSTQIQMHLLREGYLKRNVFFQPLRTRRREARALIFSRPFSKKSPCRSHQCFWCFKKWTNLLQLRGGGRGNLGNGLKKISGNLSLASFASNASYGSKCIHSQVTNNHQIKTKYV